MARSAPRIGLIFILVLIIVVVCAISYLAWRQTVPGVRAEFSPAPKFLAVKTSLTLDLRAARGGVQSVELRLAQGQSRVTLAQQSFGGAASDAQRLQLTVDPRALGLSEAAGTLEVLARDGFWRPFRPADRPILTTPVTVDFTPPSLEVLAATRYLAQGGGGLVVARAKGASRVTINIGTLAVPAYPAGARDAGLMVGMMALPWNLPVSTPITVAAEDEAGNAVSRALSVEIKSRRFSTGTVDIKDEFLARKLPELLPERGAIPPDQVLAAFLTVNRDKRREAEQVKRQLAAKSQPRPLWEGEFLQPRNTKVFSNFAETRAYRYNGREVDTQVHLGYDLASLQQSPVPAAGSGAVVFAGPLTIYGNTVVLDHGLGLQTLYAHLSSIAVKEGDPVKRGQELGRTGTTGLAVGDHLHYEVLIHGISVTPLEWWDGKWIRDHIGKPLRDAGVPLLDSQAPAAADERPAAPARKRRTARTR